MTRRVMLAGLLALGLGLVIGACEQQSARDTVKREGAQSWLKGATDAKLIQDPTKRAMNAQTLAGLPAEDLKPIQADLQKAVAAEKNAEIKKWLKKALQKAQ